jgi:16S rRNA (guanine1207-N2)-methyltransferase
MNHSRLSVAIAQSGGIPANSRIALFRPPLDIDLSSFEGASVVVITGYFPDQQAFAARGLAVATCAEGAFDTAVVFMPRAKALARALVAQAVTAVRPDGMIWIDGQKTDGIETLLKDLRGRVTITDTLAKAHGKVFGFVPGIGAEFSDWAMRDHHPVAGFITRPGVFSADGIDPGSALLAAHLPDDLAGKGADLGAGWGWLAAEVLRRPGVKELHLVEAEAEAIACAKVNVQDGRAQFHWADATQFHPGKALDFVVTNPPFHQGRAADPALGAAFLRSAAAMLQPGGQLWLVANRSLPYEEVLRGLFMNISTVALSGGFKVLMAARPLRDRSAKRR